MRGAFFKHLSIVPLQQRAGLPRLSISEQHTLTEAGKPELTKNKILLQGCGWFSATLSVHKVKFRGLSEQGVSYPCHTTHRSSEYPVAGQEIRSTFPYSFTTLNTADVHQAVLKPWFSDVPSGQHLQDTPALHSPHVGEAESCFPENCPEMIPP